MKNHKKVIIVLLPILMIILIFGIGKATHAQKQASPDYSQSDINNNAAEYYNDAENLGISFHSDLE